MVATTTKRSAQWGLARAWEGRKPSSDTSSALTLPGCLTANELCASI